MTDPNIDAKTAEPVTPATPDTAIKDQPSPEAKTGVPSSPDVKPEPGTVPLAALHEERSKRQQLEAEIAQLRNMNSAPPMPQQQQEGPDPKKELEQLEGQLL